MITVQLNSKLGPREGTIPAALFTEQNEISLYGEVTSQSALDAALQLRYLVLHNAREVTLSIHSPGGSVVDGLALIDEIERTKAQGVVVSTRCVGLAASMAAVILAAGTKGHRTVSRNGTVMIHQVMGGMSGQQTDIEIQASRIRQTRSQLNELLCQYTGQPQKKINLDTERDCYLTARQAVEYGLADEVF